MKLEQKYTVIRCMIIVAVFCGIVSGEDVQSKISDSRGKRIFELPT